MDSTTLKECLFSLAEDDIHSNQEKLNALSVILKLLDNIIGDPNNQKYRCVKCSNTKVAEALLLSKPESLEHLLLKAGFSRIDDRYVCSNNIPLDELEEYRELLRSAEEWYRSAEDHEDIPTNELSKPSYSVPNRAANPNNFKRRDETEKQRAKVESDLLEIRKQQKEKFRQKGERNKDENVRTKPESTEQQNQSTSSTNSRGFFGRITNLFGTSSSSSNTCPRQRRVQTIKDLPPRRNK